MRIIKSAQLYGRISGYEAYKEGLENVKRPETSYEINGADYVTCEGMEPEVLTDYEGMEGTSVYTEESGMLTYEVDIAEEGMYEFGISYYPVAGNGSSIQRSFFCGRRTFVPGTFTDRIFKSVGKHLRYLG